MLDLDKIQPSECELCAQRRSTNEKAPLCNECKSRFNDYKLFKKEIDSLREHERAVARSAGVSFHVISDSPYPTPRETVLEAIKKHSAVFRAQEDIKRILKVFGVQRDYNKSPTSDELTKQWQEETLKNIDKIKEKIFKGLRPKELEVLEKRMGVKK
jgi:hypothetical protein